MKYKLICQNCNSTFYSKNFKRKACNSSCASKLKFKILTPERQKEWRKKQSDTLKNKYLKNPELAKMHSEKLKDGYSSGKIKRPKSCFRKGNIPYNKGRTPPKKQIEKQQKTLKNYYKTHSQWNKGLYKEKELKYKNCINCGETFLILNNKNKKFCSIKCSAKHREEHKSVAQKNKLAQKHSQYMKKIMHAKFKDPKIREQYSQYGAITLSKIAKRKKTRLEEKMKNLLEKNNIKFTEQFVVHIPNTVINYIVDFYLADYKLFIECDGEQWHQDKEKDKNRENKILNLYVNHSFLRFTGKQININIEDVENKILNYIYK